jgi:hypothetical protein
MRRALLTLKPQPKELGLFFFQEPTMSQVITHSSNVEDEPLLQQINACLQQLTQDQKAAVAVAALYEATEPFQIFLAYELDGIGAFSKCVELILQLSYQGKLALTRAIAEELAVLERLAEVNG